MSIGGASLVPSQLKGDDASKFAEHVGYQSVKYANSFAEFGTALYLPLSRGWVLARQIPDTTQYDGIGLYPLFCCDSWEQLPLDLQSLNNDLVSICLVPDPFGGYTKELLTETFDFAKTYKSRYITELTQDPEEFVSKHHKKQAEKGLRELEVEVCTQPIKYLDEWVSLYAYTCAKHSVTGMTAFSREAFHSQLTTPGLIMFIARRKGEVVAIHTWVTQNGIGYGHLAGHSDHAYKFNASYALYWYALKWFWKKLEFLDLGGVAGTAANENDGLSFFKKGWSTDTMMTMFCGKVLNSEAYEELVCQRDGVGGTGYFPAYRISGST